MTVSDGGWKEKPCIATACVAPAWVEVGDGAVVVVVGRAVVAVVVGRAVVAVEVGRTVVEVKGRAVTVVLASVTDVEVGGAVVTVLSAIVDVVGAALAVVVSNGLRLVVWVPPQPNIIVRTTRTTANAGTAAGVNELVPCRTVLIPALLGSHDPSPLVGGLSPSSATAKPTVRPQV